MSRPAASYWQIVGSTVHNLQTLATTLLLRKECSFPVLTSSLHVTLVNMQVITLSILLTLTNNVFSILKSLETKRS